MITPSIDCATYRIEILYPQEGIPAVRIKDPLIIPSAKIHVYGTGELCLYHPEETPWTPLDNLHEKIIPWTAEWLVFYELYLMCGKWFGPEAAHPPGK